LPEYVPPAAVHSELELFLMVLEHAARGSASRATMAVVINIFLEPIVCCLLLVDELHCCGPRPLWPRPVRRPVASLHPMAIPAGILAQVGEFRKMMSGSLPS